MKPLLKQVFFGSMLMAAHAFVHAANVSAAAAPPAESVPTASDIHFDIARFAISGNTLLSPALVEQLLAPYTGKSRDFGDVQKALEALEAAFHRRGYKVVQVELPEQELTAGVVQLRVVQPRIGKIILDGNKQFDDANIGRSLPGLRPGQTPNIQNISASLKVANENPAKKVNLQLESADKDEEVNALLKVAEDDRLWKLGASLDDTGTSETGKTHATVSLQHANVFGLDHVASLQYTTTLEKPSQVSVYGVGYHIPLYESGNSVDLFGSYSNVDSGNVSAGLVNLTVSGKGRVFGARYNHNLAREANYEPKLVYGVDYKAFINDVLFTGQQLGHDVTVRPISIAYLGAWTLPTGEASFSLNLVRNIGGGEQGSSADFSAVRTGATPDYLLLRYTANYAQTLPKDWQMRLGMTGQHTRDALIPGEQFGAGGASSVRGFSEREFSNDYGVQINAEIYTPNLCSTTSGTTMQCRMLAFYDAAQLERNFALTGEVASSSISSAGLGLRMLVDRYLNMQLDYGRALSGTGGSLKDRLHFKLNMSY